MLKSYKFRLYPTKSQAKRLDQEMDTFRFIYNLALETKIAAYQSARINLTAYDLHRQLTDLRSEYEWIKIASRDSLEKAILNVDNAFKRFFSGDGFPNFKKKKYHKSFSAKQDIRLKGGKIYFQKFRDGIKIVNHRYFGFKIRQATISKNYSKYFISCLFETGESIPAKKRIDRETSIGIDLGLKSFLVTSLGDSVDNGRFYRKTLSKLKYLQRVYSKHQGKKSHKKISSIHEKISNQRGDFLHKTSSQIINNHDTICIENLNISGMIKNSRLAMSISDAGWGEFVRQLKYKSQWYGKNLLVIGRFEPSSKTCSCCGVINPDLKLQEREWTCTACGAVLDRDVNAAINIKNFALKSLCTERILKNQEELPALMGSQDT